MFSTSGIKWLGICLLLAFLTQSCSISKPSNSTTTRPYKPKKEVVENSKSETRQKVVKYAASLKGSKYLYGGENPKGFDCSGFTSYVMKRFDVPISRTSGSQALEGKKVSLSQAKPGDLVFFSRGSKIFHVAMVVSNEDRQPKIIHSTTSKGVIVTDLKRSTYWSPKMHSVRSVIAE